jgi:hypothetical protein
MINYQTKFNRRINSAYAGLNYELNHVNDKAKLAIKRKTAMAQVLRQPYQVSENTTTKGNQQTAHNISKFLHSVKRPQCTQRREAKNQKLT